MDDNRDSAWTLAKVLELDGHEVSCMFDGLSVSDRVASFQPDVVLLDIGLPGLNGYQVAEELRRRFAREDLMLIAVTGYGGEGHHASAKRAGFDQYLVKPIAINILQEMLASRAPRR